MKKLSLIMLCLALLMTFCLSACDKGGDTQKNIPTAGDTTTAEPSDAPTPTDSEPKPTRREITLTVTNHDGAETTKKDYTVSGTKLPAHEPTLAEIKNIEYRDRVSLGGYEPKTLGIHYKRQGVYDKSGNLEHYKLEKYNGDDLVFSVPFTEFRLSGFTVVDGGVLAIGNNWVYPMEESSSFIVKLDDKGDILWTYKTEFEFKEENIIEIIEDDNGNYVVFLSADAFEDPGYDIRFVLSKDGELLDTGKTGVEHISLNLIKYNGGYINILNGLEWLDANGDPIKKVTYTSEATDYRITNAVINDGRIYLSAYTISRDLSRRLYGLIEPDTYSVDKEMLTERMRETFSAILMICDAETGEIIEFYEMGGATGGSISINDAKEISWKVENITTTYYSPYTSSFTFGGNCFVFTHTFSADGKLIGSEKIDEITEFVRI